jgi:uncharacterized membrane protein
MNSQNNIMKKIITILLIITSLSSCYNDKEELLYPPIQNECDNVNSSFAYDIYPIILNKCSISGCHNSSDIAANVVLETYEQVSGYSGIIYQVCITTQSMPIGDRLTQSEIKSLKCWLLSGSPNN